MKKSIKNREEQNEMHHNEENHSREEEQQKQKREIVSLTSQTASTALSCTSESAEITCSSWCSEPNTSLLAIGKKNGVVQVYQVEPISNYTGHNKANYGYHHHHKYHKHLYNQYHHLHRHDKLSNSFIMHSRTSKYTESNESDTPSSDSEESNSSSDSDSSNYDSNNGRTQLTHSLLKSDNTNTKTVEEISRKGRKSHTSREAKQRTRFMYKSCLI